MILIVSSTIVKYFIIFRIRNFYYFSVEDFDCFFDFLAVNWVWKQIFYVQSDLIKLAITPTIFTLDFILSALRLHLWCSKNLSLFLQNLQVIIFPIE